MPKILLGLYLLAWSLAAINPLHRDDWLLENVLPALFIPLLIVGYRRAPLSNSSYGMIFLFMLCHTLGAHYTYAEVPYEHWSQAWLGFSFSELFGFERNHYDRLIHFAYGLLLALPYREWLTRTLSLSNRSLSKRASALLTLEFILATSVVYELIEWAAAELFGGELGMLFLGTQGDIWDAHWDMFLAGLGAGLALAACELLKRVRRNER